MAGDQDEIILSLSLVDLSYNTYFVYFVVLFYRVRQSD